MCTTPESELRIAELLSTIFFIFVRLHHHRAFERQTIYLAKKQ